MAIKEKKKKDEKPAIPAKLDALLLQGFSFQAIRDQYDSAFKNAKEEVEQYLDKNTDGFDIEKGTSFHCDYGQVKFTDRTTLTYDKDKIIDLVKSGAVTLETLIGIATFGSENLKTALGEKNFDSVIAEAKVSTSMAFTGNAAFKESVKEKFLDALPKEETKMIKKVEEVDVKKELKMGDAKTKAAKAKALSKTVTTITTVTSVEDDLESILK